MSLPILVNAWKTTLIHAESKVNEAAHRRGADIIMIEQAFQNRPGADHIWRPEIDMVLPDTPDTVKADAVASLTLPEEWSSFLKQIYNQYVFSWTWTVELIDLPESTVTFSFEAKVDDFKVVLRQVQLTIFSSQLHRRALGLEDGPVFGATFNKNILRFYVSNWENDTVDKENHKGLDENDPGEVEAEEADEDDVRTWPRLRARFRLLT
ncbi:uncharacterized protein FOMMEDRAFT_32446 [Fomitiporia mediterranea MF3/22]|uniref:Uncharacterized protein n=1 Tax=Fomitiporia mediterranea (strain MF3/22) TaxID=694068 RepID=R7SG44_FOMME|nr:uncharacterized protein FOMMEDRAFT_32446 [Fomitiporia mediterranea MF3/22]EJC97683.1 hypothetical protein FOMMEDRAFT_32446 [Fomitiporia mediterranea MF3/22]